MDKVSIIVPVYNIEDCIETCIQSILKQNWDNMQILLVDDGSNDQSGEICEKYAVSDSRIQVIHRENGGLSAALNTGLDYANGEWILFVDGDDAIHKDLVKYCMRLQEKHHADIVQYAFRTFGDGEGYLEERVEECSANEHLRVVTGEEGLSYICLRDNPRDYPNLRLTTTIRWSKLYSASLFDKIRYPEGRIHEDEWRIHHVFARAKKIVFSSFPGYYYRIRKNSIMQSGVSVRNMDKADAFLDRIEFCKANKYDVLRKYMVNKCLAYCVQIFCKSAKGNEHHREVCEKIEKTIQILKKERKDFSFKSWILYSGYKFSPNLLKTVYKWSH